MGKYIALKFPIYILLIFVPLIVINMGITTMSILLIFFAVGIIVILEVFIRRLGPFRNTL